MDKKFINLFQLVSLSNENNRCSLWGQWSTFSFHVNTNSNRVRVSLLYPFIKAIWMRVFIDICLDRFTQQIESNFEQINPPSSNSSYELNDMRIRVTLTILPLKECYIDSEHEIVYQFITFNCENDSRIAFGWKMYIRIFFGGTWAFYQGRFHMRMSYYIIQHDSNVLFQNSPRFCRLINLKIKSELNKTVLFFWMIMSSKVFSIF